MREVLAGVITGAGVIGFAAGLWVGRDMGEARAAQLAAENAGFRVQIMTEKFNTDAARRELMAGGRIAPPAAPLPTD